MFLYCIVKRFYKLQKILIYVQLPYKKYVFDKKLLMQTIKHIILFLFLYLLLWVIFILPIALMFGDPNPFSIYNKISHQHSLLLRSYMLMPLLCASALITKLIEKESFYSLGIKFDINSFKKLFIGLVAGFAMISIIFFLGHTFGLYSFVEYGSIGNQIGWILLLFLVGFFGTVVFEEMLYRGYIFQKLIKGTGIILALLITSFVFALNHSATPYFTVIGLVNLVIFGILMGLIYIKTNSLWPLFGLHFSWNLSQSFIYSLPLNGMEFQPHLLKVTIDGPKYLSGGNYGMEGSVLVTLILCIACALLIIKRNKNLGSR